MLRAATDNVATPHLDEEATTSAQVRGTPLLMDVELLECYFDAALLDIVMTILLKMLHRHGLASWAGT